MVGVGDRHGLYSLDMQLDGPLTRCPHNPAL